MNVPTILIINDDGITAPGIRHLWNAIKDHYRTIIVAPAQEQSGVGLCFTMRAPLHVDPFPWEGNISAWQISGTPVDCVRIALHALLPHKPDLVLSGINRGGNAGSNVLYSGTVGGIIEATLRGIPGIAFSCHDYDDPGYSCFEDTILPLVQYIQSHPLPKGCFLNVNFPSSYKQQHKGFRLAKQGASRFKENLTKGNHPEGKDYYWMGCDWLQHEEHEDSDIALLQQGFIPVVPVHIAELTHHDFFAERHTHFHQQFQRK